MASNGSATAILSNSKDSLSSSQLLGSSISSLSNSTSSRHGSSQISKIYRQASTLFLTRRLPESLSTILPVITPPSSEENGSSESGQLAPVATASRSTRIKVWSLYLTILNAILEQDPDEGKQAFGSQEWRALVTKVRDGEVWEEVVRNGYGGIEGNVDADVVINLSTILLTHSRSQTLNQQRLESYLASSHNPPLDISSHLSSTDSPRRIRSPSKTHGTDTPRDLTTRIRILELFTLHVLRQNNEWEYARSFISSSPDLDEERREAFLLALQQIQDEDLAAERSSREEQRRKEEELQQDMEASRRRRLENEDREKEEQERRRRGRDSVDDYGVVVDGRGVGHQKSKSSRGGGGRDATLSKQSTSHLSHSQSSKQTTSLPVPSPSSTVSPKSRSNNKAVTSPSYAQKAAAAISNLRKLIDSMGTSLQKNPMALFRMLAFIIGMLVVLGRRDVRERVRRVLGRGWGRVIQTAGMGVKVTYI